MRWKRASRSLIVAAVVICRLAADEFWAGVAAEIEAVEVVGAVGAVGAVGSWRATLHGLRFVPQAAGEAGFDEGSFGAAIVAVVVAAAAVVAVVAAVVA
eukprot:CAMPEP_0202081954 /NCGR_PEP_ID=MMETSP0964-20121228/17165_1 /ASSEMBLY_ACC=CAM_ASM_000500 /TAXON_ID=4773 /ORGANISM="Schizochytrium aggregatum, Strain ATCC28209" /LENGTH=98 /DNA_ID=CAMNT_0048649555 /DNA_START=191 /DNA_END=483 /DNA_ORIENTATION=-